MSEQESGGCPACGGEVKELPDGSGECAACGLHLVSDESEGERLIAALASSVRAKLKTGAQLEAALSLAMAELGLSLSRGGQDKSCCAAPHTTAAPAPNLGDRLTAGHDPCPVCGSAEREDEARCAGCGLYLENARLLKCSKCDEEGDEPTCACGAILTLERLLEFFDSSAKAVCTRCRQLYVAPKAACADCQGPLRPVDGLKAAVE